MHADTNNSWDPLGEQLIYVLSPERSGSTMLQHMIEAHTLVHGMPEPKIMVPLKFAGFYGSPEQAVYDPVNQALAVREFVERLPNGEQDYLDACRDFAGRLYRQALATAPGTRCFVDKSTPNVLVWDFLVKVYPRARYIALVRHPAAIIHSVAKSFYVGDYTRMAGEATGIVEHIAALADFLENADVPHLHVRYEDMVARTEPEARRMLEFLGLAFEDAVVNYGQVDHIKGAMGDPLTVHREQRPNAAYAEQWIAALREDPSKRPVIEQVLAPLSDGVLARYGYPRSELFAAVDSDAPTPRHDSGANAGWWRPYHIKRRIYFALRWMVQRTPLRGLVKAIRYYCEVLLR